MNLFTGMTREQILSFVLAFGLFNVFAILEAVALAAFFFTSRPVRGRVPTAAAWHVVAAIWFNWAIVSTVWAAPAEKSFVNGSKLFDLGYDRFQKVLIGLTFTGLGLGCMVIGAIGGIRQRRKLNTEAEAA